MPSSGSRKECAEAVAELSYGRHRGVRFEIADELGQPDVCPVGANAVLQEFQADGGGIEGAVEVSGCQACRCEAAGADRPVAR
ncbi:hypothetical protein [Streptomyces murinus]